MKFYKIGTKILKNKKYCEIIRTKNRKKYLKKRSNLSGTYFKHEYPSP